jgi:hypothetical protein
MLAGTPAYLTEVFRGFPQPIQEDAAIVPQTTKKLHILWISIFSFS